MPSRLGPAPGDSMWQRAARFHRGPMMALGLLLGAAVGAAALGIWSGHSGARAFERTVRAQHDKLRVSRQLSEVWPLAGQVDGPVNDVFTSHDPEGERARMRLALQRFHHAVDAVRGELRSRAGTFDIDVALQGLNRATTTVEAMAALGEQTFDAVAVNDFARAATTMAAVDSGYRQLLIDLTTVQTSLQLREDHDLDANLDELRELTTYDTATTAAGIILLIASALYIRRDTRLSIERSVLANAQDRNLAIAEYTADGALITANGNFLAMTGYSSAEIRGQHHRMFVDTVQSGTREFHDFWQALQRGEHQTGLYRRTAKFGRTLWVQASYYPIRYGDGRPAKIVEFAQDLTAQHIADIERAALATVVDACGDAIVTRTFDGVVTSWNVAAEELFGYSDGDMIGERDDRLLSESEERQRDVTIHSLQRHERVSPYEAVRFRRNGTSVPVSVGAFAIRDAAGTITGIGEIIRDISERADAESLLHQIQAGLDAHAILATTDPRGRITFVNDKFCEISQYSREELIGQDHRIVKSGEHSPDFIRDLWTTIKSGATWRGQLHNRAKDGSSYWVDTTIVPMRDSAGEISKFVAIRTDVTEHRKAVLLLERTAQLMEERNKDLADANSKALAATRAKSAFLASMSHEIRTPMNAVVGMTDLLNETSLDAQQREYVGRLSRAAANLLELLNDILDISKIEANQLTIETKTFDLHAMVDGAAELLAPRAFAKRLEFVTVVSPGVPTFIEGDQTRIRQVLLNLVGNAIKFTKRGEVVVRIESVDGADGRSLVQFAVSDTGIGIPSDKLARVFESFTQADTSTTRKYGGTGLGLSISKRLVELMGGQLEVTSSPGCGSTFTFTLDVRRATPDAADSAYPSKALEGQCALLVMRHETSRLAVASYIADAGGHVVEAAEWGSAQRALQSFDWDGRRPTVVILEHEGDSDSVSVSEMAEVLNSRDAYARLPIVLCSSDLNQLPGDDAARLHVVAQLTKPVARKQLITVLTRSTNVERPAGTGADAAGLSEGSTAVSPGSAIQEPARLDPPVRLLVVEDLEENREVVRLYLKNLPYEIETAANGLAGVNQFRAGQFDLVLMDVQMPLMDGYEATASIRAWEREQGRTPTPIVALTASAFSEDVERALQAGCTAHIVKPLRKAVLLDTIRRHVKHAAERAA